MYVCLSSHLYFFNIFEHVSISKDKHRQFKKKLKTNTKILKTNNKSLKFRITLWKDHPNICSGQVDMIEIVKIG